MSFMEAYKHLDKICKEMNGVGVTGYIEDMERLQIGRYGITGCASDYEHLKHYRWARNRIAHDPGVEEETLCEPGDEEWLENFYQRIMNRQDPLARLTQMLEAQKARRKQAASNPLAAEEPPIQPAPVVPSDQSMPKKKTAMWKKVILALLAMVVLGILLWNMLLH